MSKWIKKDDKVLVIAGNDRGKMGVVLHRQGERLVVQGVNVRKRHLKRRSEAQRAEIVAIEKPIHISNVCLCNDQGTRLKLKVRLTAEGGKELVYLDQGTEVVHRQIKKSTGVSHV